MWNQFNTADYEGQIAETVTISGYNEDRINAYMARPLGSGPYPSIVLIHHLPGWTNSTVSSPDGSRITGTSYARRTCLPDSDRAPRTTSRPRHADRAASPTTAFWQMPRERRRS